MIGNDNKISIIIKAWETYQNIAKGFGDNVWKIRTSWIGFWAATIGYGYKNNDKNIIIFSLLIIFMFLILEGGARQLQIKYIQKSISIERTLNDILVGDEDWTLPNNGVSTNFRISPIKDSIDLFKFRRWGFWLPYLILISFTLVLFCYRSTPSDDISSVDTNGNGQVTIKEAEDAGFSMPIMSDHWLYPYMHDNDNDGMVGE
jgi:hypothetical protein